MTENAQTTPFGTPKEGVTHWGISRIEKGKAHRLEFSDEHGVHVREWPLADLTIDTVRARWSAGEFRVHWLRMDPENGDPAKRCVSEGNGRVVRLEPETPRVFGATSAAPSPSSDVRGMLEFATTLMAQADRRASEQVNAIAQLAGVMVRPSESGGGDAALRAEVAQLRAKMEADEKRREDENRHRAEIDRIQAAHDEQIAELQAEIEDARTPHATSAPKFAPGEGSLVQQIGYGLLNAAAARPDIVATILTPVLSRFMAPQPAAPAPVPHPLAPATQTFIESAQAGSEVTEEQPSEVVPVQSAMPQTPLRGSVAPAPSVPVVGPNGELKTPARAAGQVSGDVRTA